MEVVQDARKSLEALQLADTSRYDFIEVCAISSKSSLSLTGNDRVYWSK